MELISTQKEAVRLIADNEMVLLYFGNNSCGVCKVMKPKVKILLQDYPNIKSATIEADKSLDLSASYSVFTLPVILVFAEGKEVIREARHISLLGLNEKLSRYYGLVFE